MRGIIQDDVNKVHVSKRSVISLIRKGNISLKKKNIEEKLKAHDIYINSGDYRMSEIQDLCDPTTSKVEYYGIRTGSEKTFLFSGFSLHEREIHDLLLKFYYETGQTGMTPISGRCERNHLKIGISYDIRTLYLDKLVTLINKINQLAERWQGEENAKNIQKEMKLDNIKRIRTIFKAILLCQKKGGKICAE